MTSSVYVGEKAQTVLREVFGYDAFRPLQKEIIERTLQKQDTLAILPTGSGKSLCYQVPALIFEGLTVVISPLIALMQDQVSALKQNGVAAAFLNSTLDADEWAKTSRLVQGGQIKLLYLSPEALNTRRMQNVLRAGGVKIECITVDEAHCVSEWGHDFRPDYMQIADFRMGFPDAVLLALTATATEKVRADIIKNLKMKDAAVLISSFNRKNIYLEVRPKRDAFDQVLQCIKAHKGECGIVYCFSKRGADLLAQKLFASGISCTSYHAGLSSEVRAARQEDFVKGRVDVITATIAFGMGINVPNVRFVIHYDLPKSIEQYYQEIGRAGRDGLPSHALLLYGAGDIQKIRYFFNESADRAKDETLLQSMIKYASGSTCRRRTLLSYFGEDAAAGNSGEVCCDVCSSPVQQNDVTVLVQKFLSCVIRTECRFGASYIAQVLTGSKSRRIMEMGHDKLSTYNIGKELNCMQWLDLADCMEAGGLIKREEEYHVVEITEKGMSLLRSRAVILLPFVKKTRENALFVMHKKTAVFDSNTQNIIDALKDWRRRTANEENVPAYIICGDKTIEDIALKKPHTMSELLNVFGIGRIKANKFGKEILRIVDRG